MVIGITGNSGTGKSEIAKLLAEKINAEIINADLVAKKLSEPGNIYNEKIIELFGEEILENKKINRKKLAEIYGQNEAEGVIIQYGGSVKSSNAKELFEMSDIDGGLVGGASLKADEFSKIVNFAE